MAFSLVKDTQETEFVTVRIASQAYTIGDLVYSDRTSDSIDVLPVSVGNGTPNSVFGVAMQTVTSSATTLLVAIAQPWQVWKVNSTNNSSANHNYQRMIIGASAAIVNNTGTDVSGSTAIFQQTGVTGLTADKLIVGNILKIYGVSV